MSESTDPVVVVGGGMAGGRAAEFLAHRGKLGGRLVLVSAEGDRPYHRPPLSKSLEVHDPATSEYQGLFFRAEEYYPGKGIELVLGTAAIGLNSANQVVKLNDGSERRYSKLLITTGCEPRRLPVDGAQLPGVWYMRSLSDAMAFWAEAKRGGAVVIIGGGFIGCEVAATLRQLGNEVTVIEAGHEPLGNVLGNQVGSHVRAIHQMHGVQFRTEAGVRAILGTDRAEGVRLSTGEVIVCRTVLIGIGARPVVDWLKPSGIELDDGIVIDEYCRTSLPNVYAAGDVACWDHPLFGRLRVEHETNAQNQAVAAARNIIGMPTSGTTQLPYVWSDQYGMRIEYVGHASNWDEICVDHSPAGLVALYVEHGLIHAVACFGRDDVIAAARAMFAEGPVTKSRFFKLARLSHQATGPLE